MTLIRLVHSPDSDDAFMFYALAAGKIPTDGRQYEHELSDIETLNQRALKRELDVTAVSIHAYAYLAESYALLSHGASMGDRYGPKLVSIRAAPSNPREATRGLRIAIPGPHTTAALVLQLYQSDFAPVIMPFDEIESATAAGTVDAGILIHEGQLTYADHGLHLWADMGEWWYDETRLPLPLGGNAIRRDLGTPLMQEVSRDLKASIEYGLTHREEALAYAMGFARGLDPEQADTFVGMYVNAYTVDYGETGRRAVQILLARGVEAGIIPNSVDNPFFE
jgi:1,4-dihydroxy-6-naphthoate synthase